MVENKTHSTRALGCRQVHAGRDSPGSRDCVRTPIISKDGRKLGVAVQCERSHHSRDPFIVFEVYSNFRQGRSRGAEYVYG